MVLTRDFKHTMAERAERDPAFAKALLDEAATLFWPPSSMQGVDALTAVELAIYRFSPERDRMRSPTSFLLFLSKSCSDGVSIRGPHEIPSF